MKIEKMKIKDYISDHEIIYDDSIKGMDLKMYLDLYIGDEGQDIFYMWLKGLERDVRREYNINNGSSLIFLEELYCDGYRWIFKPSYPQCYIDGDIDILEWEINGMIYGMFKRIVKTI